MFFSMSLAGPLSATALNLAEISSKICDFNILITPYKDDFGCAALKRDEYSPYIFNHNTAFLAV
jgi:hypothetical protein